MDGRDGAFSVEVLSDVPVSPNLRAAGSDFTCAYPFVTVTRHGEVLCLYRRGREKHSYDGLLCTQSSRDGGRTWSAPSVVFDGRDQDPPLCVVTGTIAETVDGCPLVMMGTVDVTRPDVYVFSDEGWTQRRRVWAVRGRPRGAGWLEPQECRFDNIDRAGITARPFTGAGNRLWIPLEVSLPSGVQATALAASDDGGRTVGPLRICAGDAQGELSLCDARFARLQDGRLMMLLWTFRRTDEKTLPVHCSFSDDNGESWTPPQATAITGQIAQPLAVGRRGVIAACNYRLPPEGIRLWYSPDGGAGWDAANVVQMWDPAQAAMVAIAGRKAEERARDSGVWAELDKFTFGTPDLLRLGGEEVLMTYYATLNDICHVRACRFRVREGTVPI